MQPEYQTVSMVPPPQRNAFEQNNAGIKGYRLRRYLWRATLGVVGPVLLLGLYAFIAIYFIRRQPQNNILTPDEIDATTVFYIWFVAAVFALEWARTALANFQAAALMVPRYAPKNASTLFWHADDNWANPLWWLRAIRNLIVNIFSSRRSGHAPSKWRQRPGLLWLVLSLTSSLIFIAIPLSGLTMEIVSVSKPGGEKAQILGPDPRRFSFKALNSLPSVIEGTWKSGGRATPPDSSYFFAPEGTKNVSLTHFEDMLESEPDRGFTVFLGPAVNDIATGSAFGMETTLHCTAVAVEELKLVHVNGWHEYSLKTVSGMPPFVSVSESGTIDSTLDNPSLVFLNETRSLSSIGGPYSFVAAADGAWYGNTPFARADNVDLSLYNSLVSTEVPSKPTAAFLEVFLWQGVSEAADARLDVLLADSSPQLLKGSMPTGTTSPGPKAVGFAIQCSARSAVGFASLDPRTRTYNNFSITNTTGNGGDSDVYGPQVLALMALGDYESLGYHMRQIDTRGFESRWVSFHQGIGQPASSICFNDCDNPGSPDYGERTMHLALTPANLTFSLYRLLGQSIIASMAPGSQDPWTDDLYLLERARWLKPGPVSWKPVLALLALWTVITVSLSLWSIWHRRWAPTLGGFELFRFGGVYTEDIENCAGRGFEECSEALSRVPGMVGVLSGGKEGAQEGFVGLSAWKADQIGRYVWRRDAAGKIRGV